MTGLGGASQEKSAARNFFGPIFSRRSHRNLRLEPTGPKKLRAADFSWEAPPSLIKTTISSSAIIALRLRHKRYSVPPKESNACFNDCERMPPPKPPLTAVVKEPDPIYPYLPFLFCSSFGNDCAINSSESPKTLKSVFAGVSLRDRKITGAEGAELVPVRYNPNSTNDRLSLGLTAAL